MKREGAKAGHKAHTLKRALRRAGVTVHSGGYSRRTYWTIPPAALQSEPRARGAGESVPTVLTVPNRSETVGTVGTHSGTPREDVPTAGESSDGLGAVDPVTLAMTGVPGLRSNPDWSRPEDSEPCGYCGKPTTNRISGYVRCMGCPLPWQVAAEVEDED